MCVPSCYLATTSGYTVSNTLTRTVFLAFFRTFLAAGTCLPSCNIAVNGEMHFTELLPSNVKRDTHTYTDWWVRHMRIWDGLRCHDLHAKFYDPRVEGGKNTSIVIPASRKRRRKGNRISLRWDSANRPKRRLMRTYFWISLLMSYRITAN
jgi:hypothetical protein